MDIKAIVIGPDGKSQAFTVEQTGLGRYEGTFSAENVGTYLLHASYREGNRPVHLTTGLSVAYSSEYLNVQPNMTLLNKIANVSKGRMLSLEDGADKTNIFLHGEPGTSVPIDIWPYLLIAFIVLFPLDIFLRRVHLDYKKIFEAFHNWLSRSPKEKKEVFRTVSQLEEKTLQKREELRKKIESLDLKKLEGKSFSVFDKIKAKKTEQTQTLEIPKKTFASTIQEAKESSIETLRKKLKK